MIAQRLVIASLLLSFLCTNSQGSPPAKSILASWRAGREKIQNGHVEILVKNEDKNLGNNSYSIDYYFDFPNGYFAGRVTSETEPVGVWLYTDDFFASCGDPQKPYAKLSLVKPGSSKLAFVKNLDVRIVDFMLTSDWGRYPAFDEIMERAASVSKGKVEEKEGKYHISLDDDIEGVSRRIRAAFDPSMDFACTEMDFF